LQIFFRDKIFLITGDAPKKIEEWLVKKYGKKLKSNILLAGHHGSKTSSSEEFLKVVNPDLIIFSAGKDNPYHHPNKEIIDLVKELKIKYLRTDEVGTIRYLLKADNWKWKYTEN
jgi:competence protein ComEC